MSKFKTFKNGLIRILWEVMKTTKCGLSYKESQQAFECLSHWSEKTFFNLLKIEKTYNIHDEEGNILFIKLLDDIERYILDNDVSIYLSKHFLKRYGPQKNWIREFKKYVWASVDEIILDVNLQDEQGCSPLHYAALFWPLKYQALEVLLKLGIKLDVFLQDCNGNNFLHCYCQRYHTIEETDFIRRFVKGQLTLCPKPVMVKLLNSQNAENNTPLYTFLDSHLFQLETLKEFLELGLDLNLKTKKGENALQFFISRFGNFEQINEKSEPVKIEELIDTTKAFVKHGTIINAMDKRGEHILFKYTCCNILQSFICLGADVNLINNLGQTPFLGHFSKSADFRAGWIQRLRLNWDSDRITEHNLNIVRTLLDNGSDINVTDSYGNNALHYIAWNASDSESIVTYLFDHHIEIKLDKQGHLPCEIAKWRGEEKLFQTLCSRTRVCSKHTQPCQIQFRREIITCEKELMIPQSDCIKRIFDRFEIYRGDMISDITDLPGLGKVVFEDEAAMIRVAVSEIVTNLCISVSEKDPFYSFTLVESGSVSENTKVGLPDEFDYMCIFDKIGEICEVDKDNLTESFVYLKKQSDMICDAYDHLFDKKGYLDIAKICQMWNKLLDGIIKRNEIVCQPNVFYYQHGEKLNYCPVFRLEIQWIGYFYKCIKINIDIAPACQIRGWWPVNANIQSLSFDSSAIKEEGFLLLLQTDQIEYRDEYICGSGSSLRISASLAEKLHLEGLPTIATDAYIICKTLCNERLCPIINECRTIDSIKSYMLKITLFWVFHRDNPILDCKRSYCRPDNRVLNTDNLYKVVVKIFNQYRHYCLQESLPSYLFPWQNVFTFDNECFDIPNSNQFMCAKRRVFAEVILSMLGQDQDFRESVSKLLSHYIVKKVTPGVYEVCIKTFSELLATINN